MGRTTLKSNASTSGMKNIGYIKQKTTTTFGSKFPLDPKFNHEEIVGFPVFKGSLDLGIRDGRLTIFNMKVMNSDVVLMELSKGNYRLDDSENIQGYFVLGKTGAVFTVRLYHSLDALEKAEKNYIDFGFKGRMKQLKALREAGEA